MTGTAFAYQPTYQDNPKVRGRETSNHTGDWWIGGFEKRTSPLKPPGGSTGDAPVGTMTSPYFRIMGPKLRFKIGGGCDVNLVRVELLIDGVVIAKSTGKCLETMETRVWELDDMTYGQQAQVRLVDNGKTGWSHINFDHLEMFYKPLKGKN